MRGKEIGSAFEHSFNRFANTADDATHGEQIPLICSLVAAMPVN
jgi:hypothetical protein